MQIKWVLITVAVLLGNQIFADDRTANSAGESVPNAGVQYPSTLVLQPWQQCLRELCGDELGRYQRELNEYSVKNYDRQSKEFLPLIQAAVSSGREELAEEKVALENMIQAYRQDESITSARALQLREIDASTDHLSEMILNADGSVDSAATREALKKIPGIDVDSSLKATTVYRKLQKEVPPVAYEHYGILRQRFSETELQKQVNEAVAEIEKNETTLATHFGMPREAVFAGVENWSKVRERLTSQKFDAYDIERLNERYGSPLVLARMVEAFPISKERKSLKVRDLVSAKLLSEAEARLKNINEYLAGAGAKDQPVVASLTKTASYCYTGAVAIEKYFPQTNKEIENFKPVEKVWRNEYIAKLTPHLSTETMGSVRPFFASLKIDPPKTREIWMKDVVQDLANIKAQATNEWMNRSKEAKQLGVVVFLMSGSSGDSLNQLAEETDKLCISKGEPIADESDMASDRVGVGAHSIKEPKLGRNIAFHEYSHTLSGFIRREKVSNHSRAKFDGWRSCLVMSKAGSKKYLEEDFADLLGYNLSGEKVDAYCQRSHAEDAGAFTLNRSDSDKEGHSTYLYRLLHAAAILDKVPKVCTAALEAKGEEFKLNNCMTGK